MEEPCQELSSIAFELFDRYGRLKKELKDHPIRRGTGIWGSELDLGALFIIEYMLIEKDWRRKGVGTKIATCLIEKSRTGDRSPQFSLVAPGWLNHDIDSDIRGKTKLEQREVRFRVRGAAISFYRSLGFRRIGASRCFGLPTDPSHEAHTILSTADFDSADEEPEVDEGPEAESIADWVVEDTRKSWRLKLLQERLPLHHAAITLADNDCVEFFKAFKKSETLADAWAKVDRYAKNVLHISACELKVKSVRWLLEHSNDGQILSSARNVDGYTPLEELESRLETKRTQMEHGVMVIVISDQFRGFPADAIGCLAALRQLPQVSTTQYLQLKFGCTCGSCVDGFLSPRMKFALLCQAEITHDMLNNDVEDAEMWCMMHDYLLIHVAPDIRQNFRTNKSYRQGFANVFDHIGSALRANKAPTIVNILDEWRNCSEWPPHTKNFFQRGGNAESALYIIFDQARDQDWWAGDGEHMEIFSEDVKALPECRNDHEFGFVALACGLSELAP
jgi:GNAT superfamily N-acetyltransferase